MHAPMLVMLVMLGTCACEVGEGEGSSCDW